MWCKRPVDVGIDITDASGEPRRLHAKCATQLSARLSGRKLLPLDVVDDRKCPECGEGPDALTTEVEGDGVAWHHCWVCRHVWKA